MHRKSLIFVAELRSNYPRTDVSGLKLPVAKLSLMRVPSTVRSRSATVDGSPSPRYGRTPVQAHYTTVVGDASPYEYSLKLTTNTERRCL